MPSLNKTTLGALIYLFATLCASNGLGAQPGKSPFVQSTVTGQPFVADLLYTEGSPKKLAILFLGGAEGGKPVNELAMFLAKDGYPVLRVAYFKEKGLPDALEMIPLEYFGKAIGWMQNNERIRPNGIVVVGKSKGAELALLLASKHPDIVGVVAVVPSSVVWQGIPKTFWPAPPALSSWSLHGNPTPFVPWDYSHGFNPFGSGGIHKLYQQSLTQKDAVEKAAIEVEKIHGPVLLISGHDDSVWPSEEMADAICDRLKEKGFSYPYTHLKYMNAGHIFSEDSKYGGTAEGNKQARIDSEDKILKFLQAIEQGSSSSGGDEIPDP
jgi:dienelactone hydrolase